jgi:hypothetical protein
MQDMLDGRTLKPVNQVVLRLPAASGKQCSKYHAMVCAVVLCRTLLFCTETLASHCKVSLTPSFWQAWWGWLPPAAAAAAAAPTSQQQMFQHLTPGVGGWTISTSRMATSILAFGQASAGGPGKWPITVEFAVLYIMVF